MIFSHMIMATAVSNGILEDFESYTDVYPPGWTGTQRGSVGPGHVNAYSGSTFMYIGTGSSGSGTIVQRNFTISGYNTVRVFVQTSYYASPVTYTFNGTVIPDSSASFGNSTVSGWYQLDYPIPAPYSGTLNVYFDGYKAVQGSLGQGTGAQVGVDCLMLVNK